MPFVKVISSQEGFRRGGRAWSKAPTCEQVSEDVFEMLDAEPMLTVSQITAEEFQAETGTDPKAMPGEDEAGSKSRARKDNK